jgi:hypothetical protein
MGISTRLRLKHCQHMVKIVRDLASTLRSWCTKSPRRLPCQRACSAEYLACFLADPAAPERKVGLI